jgi:hypothetical protein
VGGGDRGRGVQPSSRGDILQVGWGTGGGGGLDNETLKRYTTV